MRARTLTRWSVASVIVVGSFTGPQSAHADDTSVSVTMAQALFEEGTDLLSQGDLEAACPKLAESHRLAPAGGTVYNLAVCFERRGKTASAYVAYDEALARASRDGLTEREATVRARLAALKTRLVRFVVRPSEVASPIDVRLDGEKMRPETWNTPVPVDPGVHEVYASANGGVLAHEELSLDEPGRIYEWKIPPSTATGVSFVPKEKASRDVSTKKTAGTIMLVSGGLLVATGAVFGTMAMGAHGSSNAQCPTGPTSCTGDGVDAEANAKGYAWGANIGIGAGLISLAVGAVLLLGK